MAFENFIELNNIVANGFLISNILSLIRKDKDDLDEADIDLLRKEALNHINLVKRAQNYISKRDSYIKSSKLLEAYRTTLNALCNSEEISSLDEFNEILDSCIKEIKYALSEREINRDKLERTDILFSSIRSYLLKESEDIIKENEMRIFKKP